jgi:hypothetical protein
MGGLTIDRRETINTLDQLSRDEITAKLADLQSKYPQAFQIEGRKIKDVTPADLDSKSEIIEYIEVKAPAPSCFHLFRGSQAIDLAQKPMSEVRGPRFSGLGEVWDALRLEAVDHFAKLQSLQSPAAKSA